MPGTAHTIRAFIALWPQDTARKQLNRLARQFADSSAGRCIQPENLHLTLVFIGEINSSAITALRQAIGVIRQPSFDLLLDQVHFWKKGGIIAAGAKHPPAELTALVQDLRHLLSALEIPHDTREFVPHVTLVRNAKYCKPPDSIPALGWRVTCWSLVQSRLTPSGVTYQSLTEQALEPEDFDEHRRI